MKTMEESSSPIDYHELAKIGVYGFEIHWKVQDILSPRSFKNSGVATAVTEDDATDFGRELANAGDKLAYRYEITIYEKFMKKWIWSWDSSKERVAPPTHRVFVVMGGRDCDGFDWTHYYSFRTLEDAAEHINDSIESVDGPSGYSTMSCDEWEIAGHPEYRDRYAEQMGY